MVTQATRTARGRGAACRREELEDRLVTVEDPFRVGAARTMPLSLRPGSTIPRRGFPDRRSPRALDLQVYGLRAGGRRVGTGRTYPGLYLPQRRGEEPGDPRKLRVSSGETIMAPSTGRKKPFPASSIAGRGNNDVRCNEQPLCGPGPCAPFRPGSPCFFSTRCGSVKQKSAMDACRADQGRPSGGDPAPGKGLRSLLIWIQ